MQGSSRLAQKHLAESRHLTAVGYLRCKSSFDGNGFTLFICASSTSSHVTFYLHAWINVILK